MIRTARVLGSRIYLHPEPRKIIHLIGGFGFGSWPSFFYDALARELTEKSYSVILHPFPFSPFRADHWQLAIDLYKRLKVLQLRDLPRLGADPIYLEGSNHAWLGHSLGCKLIELLEVLSLEPEPRRLALRSVLSEAATQAIEAEITRLSADLGALAGPLLAELERSTAPAESGSAPQAGNAELPAPAREKLQGLLQRRIEEAAPRFIRNQTSILMAPQISGAVRLPCSGITIYNAEVQPSWEESCFLVRTQKSIFQLTGLVGFTEDTIARDDVLFLKNVLSERPINQPKPYPFLREIPGLHLAPLRPGALLIDTIDSLLTTLSARRPPETPAA